MEIRYRYYPYVMAALEKAGLDEGRMELVDFVLDRRGMGQYHLRGADVPPPAGAAPPAPGSGTSGLPGTRRVVLGGCRSDLLWVS